MKKMLRVLLGIVLFILSFGCVVACGGTSGTSTENPPQGKTDKASNAVLYARAVDNTSQILKTETSLGDETTLSFSGAKGERETGQLILHATSNILSKKFSIDFTDFVAKDGGIISKSAVSTYIEIYNKVTTQFVYGTKSGEDMTFGYFPNGLLPMSVAAKVNKNRLNLSADENQGLFFILNIPSDARKGIYSGNITIKVSGNEDIVMPVEIEVYGFTLPEENANRTEFCLSTYELTRFYGDRTYWDTDDIYKEAISILRDRGISSGELSGSSYSSDSMPIYIDYLKKAAADPKISVYILEANIDSYDVSLSWSEGNKTKSTTKTNLGLPRMETIVDEHGLSRYGLKDIFRIVADNSTNELDLFKKAIICKPAIDEPSWNDAFAANILSLNVWYKAKDWMLENYDWTGKEGVRESLRNLTYHITAAPMPAAYDGLTNLRLTSITPKKTINGISTNCGLSTGYLTYKAANGYIVRVWRFDPANAGDTTYNNYDALYEILDGDYTGLSYDNYSLWWYTCVGADDLYASMATNAPMIQYRVNYWQQYELGIGGNFFWLANITQNYVNVGTNEDPVWEYQTVASEADLINNGTVFQGQAGDGHLIISVKNTYGAYGVNWLTTLRLENVAEGIDDYNYLAYAQSLINAVKNASLKATYQARFDTVYTGLFNQDGSGHNYTSSNTKDASVLKASRSALAKLIEDLLEA